MGILVFDVNETLSDLSPLAHRFIEVGAPASLLAPWFAGTLRDGNALSMAGTPRPFVDVARGVLDVLWSQVPGFAGDPHQASEHVLAGFGELGPHPDVVPGITDLHEAGHRLVTLSNGASWVAEGLLERAGIAGAFERLLSVDDAGAWKPDPRAYRYAAECCSAEPGDLALVAVHPWDVHGAHHAGLRTVWLDRSEAPYAGVFDPPDLRVTTITELPDALVAAPWSAS